jgi:hypothetical protein
MGDGARVMWGDTAMGSLPFGALADIDNFVCVLASADIEADFTYILYVATREFATEPDDVPSSRPFRGVLAEPLRSFRRSILGATIGEYATGDGVLVVQNTDAEYDRYIRDYAIDGREIVVKLGRVGIDDYADFFTVFSGTAADWDADEETLTIYLRDNGYRLEVPAQSHVYAGTGDEEGGEDLTGKRIPLAFGAVLNVPPTLVVANQLVHQVHDGEVQDIPAVYDRGVALTQGVDVPTFDTLIYTTVPAGYYATCLAQGFFKLGSTPSGTITADVEGAVVDGVFLSATGQIVRHLIGTATDLVDPDDVDTASFAALAGSQSTAVGYWLGPDDTLTVRDVVAQLMGGIGGWVGFGRDGTVYAELFTTPIGLPRMSFDRTDMVGDVGQALIRERLPSGTVSTWRQRVAYQRSWTVQTDLANSVTDARRAFVAEPYRLAQASDADVLGDHPLARDPEPIEAFFSEQADALAEADRLLALYATGRWLYRMQLPRRALLLELGDVIKVTYPRWDLADGHLLRVVEITENIASGQLDTVEVVAYG